MLLKLRRTTLIERIVLAVAARGVSVEPFRSCLHVIDAFADISAPNIIVECILHPSSEAVTSAEHGSDTSVENLRTTLVYQHISDILRMRGCQVRLYNECSADFRL